MRKLIFILLFATSFSLAAETIEEDLRAPDRVEKIAARLKIAADQRDDPDVDRNGTIYRLRLTQVSLLYQIKANLTSQRENMQGLTDQCNKVESQITAALKDQQKPTAEGLTSVPALSGHKRPAEDMVRFNHPVSSRFHPIIFYPPVTGAQMIMLSKPAPRRRNLADTDTHAPSQLRWVSAHIYAQKKSGATTETLARVFGVNEETVRNSLGSCNVKEFEKIIKTREGWNKMHTAFKRYIDPKFGFSKMKAEAKTKAAEALPEPLRSLYLNPPPHEPPITIFSSDDDETDSENRPPTPKRPRFQGQTSLPVTF